MSWPKMPDGTVDWMSVFQDPETGLIPLIDQADTSEKLRSCFVYVIDSLFSRDSDSEIRESYYAIVEDTFQDDGEDMLQAEKTKIRMVMIRVMNDRMKRAREYAAQKAAEDAGADQPRRREDQHPPDAMPGAA